ncbi:MAG: LemA family protein [Planctomycetota bacterium]|nr:LemA family protein [Planctomycetota bacterium]
MDHPAEVWVPIGGIVLSGLMLLGWMRSLKQRRLLEDLPTSKVKGVFIGLVEVKGTAESEDPLESYLAEEQCVGFDWSVDEHWSRTVTETYTDSEGKSQTRTKTESGWTQVAGGSDLQTFYLRDDTGALRINPKGAKLEMTSVFDQTCGILDPLYYDMGPAHAVANSNFRRRFYETAIVLHAPLFIVGQARERQDIVAPEIAEDENAPLFLISTRSEEQVLRARGWSLFAWAFFGLVFIVLGCVIRDLGLLKKSAEEVWPGWLVPVGIFGGGLFLAWVLQVYNSLIDLRNRTNRAWSLVDIELKRRADLIPQLIRTVEGIKGYEKEVQKTLSALRQQAKTGSGSGVVGLAPPIRVLMESYPDLKSIANFTKLSTELANTEDRIALARGYFNDQATCQNTRLERIPEGWLAQLAGFKHRKLWSATHLERTLVTVHFAENGLKKPSKKPSKGPPS